MSGVDPNSGSLAGQGLVQILKSSATILQLVHLG